jgi:hypothetical protein
VFFRRWCLPKLMVGSQRYVPSLLLGADVATHRPLSYSHCPQNASMRWAADGRVWVTAGAGALGAGECAQPICGLSDALAAGWVAASRGVPVDRIHAALLQLDKYEEFYREPG